MAKIIPINNGTKKEAVLQAAASLFMKKGYAATSMRDIAVAIGIEAPSLYNHIHSKKSMLHDICFSVAQSFNEHMLEVQGNAENFLKKIENLIRFHIDMMVKDFQNVYIADNEWRHLDEPYNSDFKNQRRNYRSCFAALLRDGINNNEISDVDADIAVLTILSAIGGIESWQRSAKKMDVQLLEENIVNILLKGLKKH